MNASIAHLAAFVTHGFEMYAQPVAMVGAVLLVLCMAALSLLHLRYVTIPQLMFEMWPQWVITTLLAANAFVPWPSTASTVMLTITGVVMVILLIQQWLVIRRGV